MEVIIIGTYINIELKARRGDIIMSPLRGFEYIIYVNFYNNITTSWF